MILDRIEGEYAILVAEKESIDVPLEEFCKTVVIGGKYRKDMNDVWVLEENSSNLEYLKNRMKRLKKK